MFVDHRFRGVYPHIFNSLRRVIQRLDFANIFPTGWPGGGQLRCPARRYGHHLGAGPVGQMAIRSAVLLGAKQVVLIGPGTGAACDEKEGGAITISFDEESVLDRLKELTNGRGPEKCIDAVGKVSHATRSFDAMYDRVKQAVMLETNHRTF